MSKKKIILLGLLAVLVIIQFIRPEKNDFPVKPSEELSAAIEMPEEVNKILVASCNDCHSNHTNNMWYQNIQPVGWWINHHIEEGKEELNFSIFNTYSVKKQAHKMEEVAEMVEEDEMPMSSYTLMHGDAKLSKEQKELLINWAKAAQDSLKLRINFKNQ